MSICTYNVSRHARRIGIGLALAGRCLLRVAACAKHGSPPRTPYAANVLRPALRPVRLPMGLQPGPRPLQPAGVGQLAVVLRGGADGGHARTLVLGCPLPMPLGSGKVPTACGAGGSGIMGRLRLLISCVNVLPPSAEALEGRMPWPHDVLCSAHGAANATIWLRRNDGTLWARCRCRCRCRWHGVAPACMQAGLGRGEPQDAGLARRCWLMRDDDHPYNMPHPIV